jgi:hypothetical protein
LLFSFPAETGLVHFRVSGSFAENTLPCVDGIKGAISGETSGRIGLPAYNGAVLYLLYSACHAINFWEPLAFRCFFWVGRNVKFSAFVGYDEKSGVHSGGVEVAVISLLVEIVGFFKLLFSHVEKSVKFWVLVIFFKFNKL